MCDERSVEARFESEILLRPAARSSHYNKVDRKVLACTYLPLDVMGGSRGHCRKSFCMTLLSQPHLSHNFRPIVLEKGVVMNDCNDVAQPNPSQALPLCSRYFNASIVDASVLVREGAGAARPYVVRCGLGFLEVGECEVLGAWLAPTSSQTLSQEVLDDLKRRGVEKVRFFVCQDPAQLRPDVCVAYPGTTVLPSMGHLLSQSLSQVAPRHRRALADAVREITASVSAPAAHDALNEIAGGPLGAAYPAVLERWAAALEEFGPLYALSARQRRVLVLGDHIAHELHQSLNRAVARHGSFANCEAAVSFLSDALRRAERRLDARGTVRATGARTSVGRPGTSVGTQALAFLN